MLIGPGIFPCIYHSIINNGLVPGGQNLSRRQTVFFLPTDPRDESHKDPEHFDFSVPRLARYMHSAWKRLQDAVFWVDIDLGIKEGLAFYQTRSNAIILQRTLPAYCIPKVERLKTGEVLYERRYLSPRPPPKISLKHDHDWTKGNDQLGSTVEHQPVGKLVQQSLGEALQAGSSKPTQSKPGDVGIVYCTCGHFLQDDTTENKKVHLIRAGFVLHPEFLHQEGPATRSQVREETRLQRIPHGKSTSKEVSKETLRKHSRSIYP